MMSARKPIKKTIETKILVDSGRRCALCFGLDGDIGEKEGQIAHLDHDKSNSKIDNLAWLCVVHHGRYDCKTSQTKGITAAEIKRYKPLLIKAVKAVRYSRLSRSSHKSSRILTPIAIKEVLQAWKTPADDKIIPLFIVVGGSSKYDSSRKLQGLKDQSTEPVVGVVRVARSLSNTKGSRFIDAVCDYSYVLYSINGPIDIILVGAGDTNRITKDIFQQNTSQLPVRFEPPTSSESIVVPIDGESWSNPEDGLVIALRNPIKNVRYAVVCAGNGARGTNAALTTLASLLRKPSGKKPLNKMEDAVVVQARANSGPLRLWPPKWDFTA
jgi:hypothetical protein